jgi:AcrR family transcriptional regulator
MSTKKINPRRLLITATAAKLFREKGYSATGMREIATIVGIEAASLYNHIQSKSELLEEICFKMAESFTNQLKEVESNPTLNCLQQLEKILRFHIGMWINHLDESIVTTTESKYLNEPSFTTFNQERKEYVNKLENIIEMGIQQGIIKTIQPYTVVLSIMSALRGIEFWHRSKKGISAKELENNMVSYLITGLSNVK